MAKNVVKIYGDISDWNENSAQEVCRRIENAQDGEVINLHLHCYGGSVFEGNLIYNAIKASKTPVDIYIDGIAASMGAIIATAARKVYMAENAFIMIHAPANYMTDGRGTADEHLKVAKLLKAMQENFIKALATRTQKAEDFIKDWMDGDNWFSASEALKERLIDGVIDPVALNIKPLTTEEIRTSQIADVYGLFAASLTQENTNPILENHMNKELMISRYGLTGVTAQSTDEEIYAAIDAKLNAEKNARKQAEDQLKEQRESQINAMLDEVTLSKEQREKYAEIGDKAGIEALAMALEPIKKKPAAPNFLAMINQDRTNVAAYNGQSWDELDKKGLLTTVKKNDPETYRALFVEKFGKEPQSY
jgi:ATP-dependent protease ClpP protease subunit